VIEHRQHGPRRQQPRLASTSTPRPGHGTPDRLPVRCLAVALAHLPAIAFPVLLDAGAVVASWPASPIERTKTRKHCRRSSTASTSTRLQPMPASHPTPRSGHGTPDRLPVCRLAVALAHLPAIATRYCSTWRRRRLMAGFTDRENEDPEALPAIEHRQHEHTPATDACQTPDTLTNPRHARSAAGAPSGGRPGPLAGDRLPGAARPGAVVVSWPASPIERTKTRKHCRRSSTPRS